MSLSLVQHHARSFREMTYVYPVISRRSGGLSLGINLSPTARCNFACVYCQVLGELEVRLPDREQLLEEGDRKRSAFPDSPLVDIPKLESELIELIRMVDSGELFQDDWFSRTPLDKRVIRDLAFSGDGEPTLSSQFAEVVRRVSAIRQSHCSAETKIVLITNGTTLNVPLVRQSLETLLSNNGEIWAKLDAGSPEYFHQVARSTISLDRVVQNLRDASRDLPLVIQTCFLSLHGTVPSHEEICAYTGILNSILSSGGRLLRVQIYTVARNTPEPWARPLSDEQLNTIVDFVRTETGLQVDAFYSS